MASFRNSTVNGNTNTANGNTATTSSTTTTNNTILKRKRDDGFLVPPAKRKKLNTATLNTSSSPSSPSCPSPIEPIASTDEKVADIDLTKEGVPDLTDEKGDKNDKVDLIISLERNFHWNQAAVRVWNFDAARFDNEAGHNGLVLLTYHYAKPAIAELPVSEKAVILWLYEIQSAYRANPYHNAVHATDVVYSLHWMLTHCSRLQLLTTLERFLCVMAAAAHDVGHDGTSNLWHTVTGSRLALFYNDRSPLENYHARFAFEIMLRDTEADWLSALVKEDQRMARKWLIELILHTDMESHRKLVEVAASKAAAVEADADAVEANLEMATVFLHAADVAGATKKWRIYLAWAEAAVVEFRAQGDGVGDVHEEMKSINKLCRRDYRLADGQANWIEFVMLKFYGQLNQWMDGELSQQIANLKANLAEWKRDGM